MFFWVNRKLSIPVNTGSDWPFSVTCSGLQCNHDVFLALHLAKRVWAYRLIPFLISCFSHVLCAKCYKASDSMLLHGNNSMAKHGSDSPCASSAKKKKYVAKYKSEWVTDL